MRRAAKIDANQQGIVDALRAFGASVQSLAVVGGGCPDILVGYKGVNVLMELKKPKGPRGGSSENGQRLSERQLRWRSCWRGQVATIRTANEAMKLLQQLVEDAA